MSKYKGLYTGWSIKGRPFSATEFKKSWLSKDGTTYSSYLGEFSRQYKIKKLRKFL